MERLPAKPVLKAPRAESTSGSVSLAFAPQSRDIETAVAILQMSAYKETYNVYISTYQHKSCIYVYVYVHFHVYVYVYTYMYVSVYIYIHILINTCHCVYMYIPEKNQNERQCPFWSACLQSCAIHMVAGHHPRIAA